MSLPSIRIQQFSNYCGHSESCPFGIVSIRDGIQSGWCPFGIVSIRDGVHSGSCPFGIVSIRDGVHSGLRPFEVVSIWAIVRIPHLTCQTSPVPEDCFLLILWLPFSHKTLRMLLESYLCRCLDRILVMCNNNLTPF